MSCCKHCGMGHGERGCDWRDLVALAFARACVVGMTLSLAAFALACVGSVSGCAWFADTAPAALPVAVKLAEVVGRVCEPGQSEADCLSAVDAELGRSCPVPSAAPAPSGSAEP